MKKTLIGLALCLAATSAMARFSSSNSDGDAGAGGIITPEVATDGFRALAVTRDKDGNLLVCPTYRRGVYSYRANSGLDTCLDAANNNAWVRPVDVPPHGKTYVGFKIVPNGYYEFYWK